MVHIQLLLSSDQPALLMLQLSALASLAEKHLAALVLIVGLALAPEPVSLALRAETPIFPELILQSTLVEGRTLADVVEMLLGAGADANLRDSLGGSALLGAAQAGHGAVIDTLTARGATCAPCVRIRVRKRFEKPYIACHPGKAQSGSPCRR